MHSKDAFQFKITLRGTRPPIWRRIQVPSDFTFWDLHVAIQDSMGWSDYHLHEFEIKDSKTGSKARIGIPDDDAVAWGEVTLPDRELAVAQYFSQAAPKVKYLYDFGDGWEHTITLEKTITRDVALHYPRCVGGKRACPPEDCGGPYGYQSFLEIIADPEHHDYEQMIDWIGGTFDAEHFDPEEIIFHDPDERWKSVFKRH